MLKEVVEYKNGDRVEHKNRGKGIFVEYHCESYKGYTDSCYVQFDENSDAEGDFLEVTIGMLKKIED